MAAMDHALTTVDNPYDPFEDYPRWRIFDEAHGYYTSQFLARLIFNSEELTDPLYEQEIERAIDEAVAENVSGMYVKVSRPRPDDESHRTPL